MGILEEGYLVLQLAEKKILQSIIAITLLTLLGIKPGPQW